MVSEMLALQKVLTRMAENVQKNTNKKKVMGRWEKEWQQATRRYRNGYLNLTMI